MCDPVSATIGAAVIGAGTSLYSGKKARKQQKRAQAQNEMIAAQNAQRSEEQFNRLNQKQPAVAAMTGRNKAAAQRGIGSTFLTGAGGVPKGLLPLGGPTLLGG